MMSKTINNATESGLPNSASTNKAYVNFNNSLLGLWVDNSIRFITHQETCEPDVSVADWNKKKWLSRQRVRFEKFVRFHTRAVRKLLRLT